MYILIEMKKYFINWKMCVQFTAYSVQRKVNSVQCTAYSVQRTVYSVQCIAYMVLGTTYRVQPTG